MTDVIIIMFLVIVIFQLNLIYFKIPRGLVARSIEEYNRRIWKLSKRIPRDVLDEIDDIAEEMIDDVETGGSL